MSLPAVPVEPTATGAPRYGTYRGALSSTALTGVGRLRRFRSEKQWQYFAAADADVAVGGAILDGNFMGTVFCWVLDRERGELVADASRLLPGPFVSLSDNPTEGTVATLRGVRRPLAVRRSGDQVRVDGSFGDVSLGLSLEAPPDRAMTAICPVDGGPRGAYNVTQKEVTTTAGGTVTVNGDRYDIDEGVGLLDHTHGLLARETSWRWGFGVGETDGELAGFNLVSGFNDALENACWVGDDLEGLDRVTIEGPPWRITDESGAIDLSLDVEGERREDVDVRLLASRYRQPIGTWSGQLIDREVSGLFGVAERHTARW